MCIRGLLSIDFINFYVFRRLLPSFGYLHGPSRGCSADLSVRDSVSWQKRGFTMDLVCCAV